jgi:uncharacterized BrkB/YihY/UPF0761 family membrane protein
MERLKRLVQALDDFQQGRRWLAFPVAVVKKYGEDQAGQRAALLAYYGFFSLFPLLLVAVTVLSFALHGRADLSERVVDSTLAQFPVIGDQIRDEVEGRRLRGSGLALVVGAALALWGGLGVAEAAQSAMKGIWNVPRRRYRGRAERGPGPAAVAPRPGPAAAGPPRRAGPGGPGQAGGAAARPAGRGQLRRHR